MVYEYIIECKDAKEIQGILKKSNKLKKSVRNISYFIGTIALLTMLLISLIVNDFSWDDRNLILIGAYLIGFIIVSVRKNINIKKYYIRIEERLKRKQSVQFEDNIYKYNCDKIIAKLSKDTIEEIIVSKNYTLIMLVPRKLKLFICIPVVIPNNLLGSEEKYNEFIKSISLK